jgi:hypothetical protein
MVPWRVRLSVRCNATTTSFRAWIRWDDFSFGEQQINIELKRHQRSEGRRDGFVPIIDGLCQRMKSTKVYELPKEIMNTLKKNNTGRHTKVSGGGLISGTKCWLLCSEGLFMICSHSAGFLSGKTLFTSTMAMRSSMHALMVGKYLPKAITSGST